MKKTLTKSGARKRRSSRSGGSVSWSEDWDENDNSIWVANSPYVDGEDGPCYEWRLKQRLVANRVEWYEAHDAELIGQDGPESWPTLAQAKRAIAKAQETIYHEIENAR